VSLPSVCSKTLLLLLGTLKGRSRVHEHIDHVHGAFRATPVYLARRLIFHVHKSADTACTAASLHELHKRRALGAAQQNENSATPASAVKRGDQRVLPPTTQFGNKFGQDFLVVWQHSLTSHNLGVTRILMTAFTNDCDNDRSVLTVRLSPSSLLPQIHKTREHRIGPRLSKIKRPVQLVN
jgi:hypothetical protein